MTVSKHDNPPTLYLIDGHAQMFRAYYAIRGGMTSPVTGEPTNALFGFTGMMLKLFEQFHPHYVAMAIDSKGETFREKMYPQYKANRDAPPEDFAQQIPRILELTQLFGVPVLAQEGAEADDIIATLTQRIMDDPKLSDVRIRLVSKDKDLEQLLNDRVEMFDIHTDTAIDVHTLREKKGITPQQAVDVQILTGDNIDNVPGVKGIGPKTASKLINEYQTLENLLSNLDQLKGKQKENIEAARELFPLVRQLITLKRDVDIDFTMDDATVQPIDVPALLRLFKELGFNRHQADLKRIVTEGNGIKAMAVDVGADEASVEASAQAPPPSRRRGKPADPNQAGLFDAFGAADDEGQIEAQQQRAAIRGDLTTASDNDYQAITTRAQLDDLVATLSSHTSFSVDTETIGLGHRAGLCGICIAWKPHHGVYIPVRSPDMSQHLDEATVINALRGVFEDERIEKLGHNLKYDYLILKHAGVTLRGRMFDSMVAAHLTDQPGLGMDALAMALLQHENIPIEDLIGTRGRGKQQKTMDQIPLQVITPYAAEDADITLRLCEKLRAMLTTLGMDELAEKIEMPLVEVLAEMEYAGIRVDADILQQQQNELQKRIDELRDQIHVAVGQPFNVDSPKQLGEILFRQLKLPVIKRTRTGPSTDVEVLEKLVEREDIDQVGRTVATLVVEYRQLTKLVGTYLEALRKAIDHRTGRVHATFHQTITATGRLSSSDPNLQNIPIRTDIGRQIRKAFVAEKDHVLICADYSQIELRILAHLSEDPALIQAFVNDMDIHRAVAAQVFGVDPQQVTTEQRGSAKVINFGIIYGVTPYGLARRIDNLDVDAAKKLIDDYRQRFKGIDTFLDQCVKEAEQTGYVTTMLGRRRRIRQINQHGQAKALGQRLAINTVVQGSAADLIKQAMINLHRRITREQLPMRLLLQIHDELVLEAPRADAERCARIVEEQMEQAMSLKVPLKVEAGIGADWYSAK